MRAANWIWARLNRHPAGLAQIQRVAQRIRFPDLPVVVPGWLTVGEQQMLYALAYLLPGPFLEIGSWVGRSTACLAYGIRDSRRAKRLISIDLYPRPEHFRPYADGVGLFYPASAGEPLHVASHSAFVNDVEPVIHAPGGALRALRENLGRLRLADLVQIINCDVSGAPSLGYRLIFCDITHSPHEIERNMPALSRLLAPGTVVACHDIDPTNEACLRKHIAFHHAFTCDSLFVGEVA